jgi:hypothetical protein
VADMEAAVTLGVADILGEATLAAVILVVIMVVGALAEASMA